MESLTIHSLFCGDCGGWERPVFHQICAHEGHISCATCDTPLLLVRTVEPVILNH